MQSMGEDFERRVMESWSATNSLINVYINGKNSKFGDGLKSALADGDEVYVLPAVAGGEEMSAKEMDRYSRQIMLEEIGYNLPDETSQRSRVMHRNWRSWTSDNITSCCNWALELITHQRLDRDLIEPLQRAIQ